MGVVLWAFETMKTGGETLAAIFHLLGVKPVWKSPYIRDLLSCMHKVGNL